MLIKFYNIQKVNVMKIKYILFALFIALSIVGCSPNNSEGSGTSTAASIADAVSNNDNTIDVNGSVSIGFVDGNSKELTLNSEVVTVKLLVLDTDNSPYSEGTISVAYPDKVRNGVDIGSFASSTVNIENGIATLSYTAPKDLQSLVDSGDTSTVFGFYHSSNKNTVKDFTFTYNPTVNQKVLENYYIKSSLSEASITVGLESSRVISFYIEDNKQDKVKDSDITSITVEVLNTSLLDLEDTLGNSGDKLVFNTKNDVSVNLKTNTISGIVPIKVTAIFKDSNGIEITEMEVVNVVVLSGPPTAISISYASTGQDEEYAKFKENLVVTVTDKYFNRVNTNPAISTGVIAGYAKDSAGNYIYHEPNSATTGTLNKTTKIFTANNGFNFSKVDESNDVLATFGLGYSYDASGKWDFTKSGAANSNELAIVDDYDSSVNRSNLGFAVGNNQREDKCRIGRKWVGSIKVTDGTNKLDSRGMALLELEYDYYLTGKDVVVWVNLVGFTAESGQKGKIGEAVKLMLRGHGLDGYSVGVPAKVEDYPIYLPIMLTDTKEWYRNGRFDYKFDISDNLSYSVTTSESDINDCTVYDGVAYVKFIVTDEKNVTGTVSIQDLLPSHEF